MLSVENVIAALSLVIEPDLKKDLVTLGMIQNLEVEGKKVSFTIMLTTPACPFKESMKRACIRAIKENTDREAIVEITLASRTTGKKPEDDKLLPHVKNIIAIASGKGGVGKSTVAANISVALAATGAKVGLIDADIYGPSVPIMFNATNSELESFEKDGKVRVLPLTRYGVNIISIGFFIDASRAIIWRGPMASSALKQLFTDVEWGELDYLLIDLPPGTGDIHLSLVQTLKLTGAVIVSTPQNVALADARKAVSMFENNKVGVNIIGLVENMSWFTPAELPGNKYFLFGNGGCRELASELNLPFLGEIPLVQAVCLSGDIGKPAMLDADNPAKPYFEKIAGAIAGEVSKIN